MNKSTNTERIKVCPKCYKEFACNAENISTCHCSAISFTKKELQALSKMFTGCLCLGCLSEIRTNFDKPARICISFQDAMYDHNLGLLAKENTISDSHGDEIELHEGKQVTVYEYDEDENNHRDDLFATGIATKNLSKHKNANYKWSIRLDTSGIQSESEIQLIDFLEIWRKVANKYVNTEIYIYEWQNDMDCRRLMDELLEKFLYLKDNKKVTNEIKELDKKVLENTFEINECIWRNQDYNPKKHWYYYRMNQLVFDNESGDFTKKLMP